jgi:hypothetical protein
LHRGTTEAAGNVKDRADVGEITDRAGRGPLKAIGTLALSVAIVAATATLSSALPGEQPSDTWMVNGPVWSLETAGNVLWIVGRFDRFRSDASGGTIVNVNNVAAVDITTGLPVAGLHLPIATGGSGPIVYDASFGDGRLFIGGKFTSVDGQARKNIAALDPGTGQLLPFTANAPGLRTVLAAADGSVYAGGKTDARRYTAAGALDAGFAKQVPDTESVNGPTIRDLAFAPDGDVLVAGAFDTLNGATHRVVAKLDPASGQPRDWSLGGFLGSKAVGVDMHVDPTADALYLGVGGSDFAGRYRLSDGAAIWKTDTSGASQAISTFGDGTVVVGGHFQAVAPRPRIGCGSNSNPTGRCTTRLRLAALDVSNGFLVTDWAPDIEPLYFGVRAVFVHEGRLLHLGGEFRTIEGVPQTFYGMLA